MNISSNSSRRSFLKTAGLGAVLPLVPSAMTVLPDFHPEPTSGNKLFVAEIKVYTVKVNQRGSWYFVELITNKGLSGFGEASHAFGNSADGEKALQKELSYFFELVKGQSPYNIEQFRHRGWNRAIQSKLSGTAFSGIEQALWDLKGKALGVPVYELLGGKLRDTVKVYANINRANNDKENSGHRSVANFQRNAEEAMKNGFKAVKLAPFDEMAPLTSPPSKLKGDIDYAVNCIQTIRQTIGNEVELLIDVHSHLNRELAIETAKRLEPYNLYWFEEPVNPGKFVQETKEIKDNIKQTLAGGESIFGVEGFAPLLQANALGIIMPDVKHCGGLQELKNIAAIANALGEVRVAPHNPSGPVATAVSAHLCANIPNFAILELAYGEVPWRAELLSPSEQFVNGHIVVNDDPGFGFTLNKKLIKTLV
ncbi:MAG TPA: mandelate racemase/muconate lactonizing enzyme family protein [Phnomibacter sp.]|nr:mandelate racemase/muconate lactonizing enzyme family protein [Phnomibacter sp.]